MKTKIKRLAQFLFDNAEMIARELRKSSHYRSVSISLNVYKYEGEKPTLDLTLSVYDEEVTHYYLHGDEISAERFKQICRQMNIDTRLISPPKPVKVREQLSPA